MIKALQNRKPATNNKRAKIVNDDQEEEQELTPPPKKIPKPETILRVNSQERVVISKVESNPAIVTSQNGSSTPPSSPSSNPNPDPESLPETSMMGSIGSFVWNVFSPSKWFKGSDEPQQS